MCVVFVCKQKTEYEMRISDWSSDVCSSDLCGYCNSGCAYGRRMGIAQTYLPEACRDFGARILPDTKADRIVWQTAYDGRREAEAVKLVLPDGSKTLVRARVGVVVAAGTIAYSKLLHRIAIDRTGSQISTNLAFPGAALMPDGHGGHPWAQEPS